VTGSGPGARPVKRSVKIAGHATSVSLEAAFWTELKRFAAADAISLNTLIARIDAERASNLSSALRVYVLARVKAEDARTESAGQ